MLEIFLLMLATSVQQAAAIDNGSSASRVVPSPAAIEAPAVAQTEAPAVIPTPAPAPQGTALNLPVFPPAPAAAPAQPASAAPQPVAPAILAPQPSAPQPSVPQAAAPQAQLAFLAPRTQAAAPAPAANLVAEPQVPSGRFLTALEVRPILNATRSNWIAVREYGGKDLLYVTHLWSWRCGLLEIRIGLNGAAPEPWPLPQCHLEQPQAAAILEGDGNPYREFPLRTVQLIEVMLTYDDLTTDRVRFNRAGVVIP